MNRALRAATLSLLLAVTPLVEGCYGPTLPLPPPTALVSPPDGTGTVDLTGEALPDAYVLALNLDTDEGVIGRADATGRYALRVRAAAGHTLEVWQMTAARRWPAHDRPRPDALIDDPVPVRVPVVVRAEPLARGAQAPRRTPARNLLPRPFFCSAITHVLHACTGSNWTLLEESWTAQCGI
jgi:hypothetical protein